MIIRTVLTSVGAAAMLVAAPPGSAQTGSQPVVAAPAIAPAASVIAPATLAKARIAALAMLPDGSMEKIFEPMMNQIMGPITDQMMQVPLGELVRIGGMSEDQSKAIGKAKLGEILEIFDPAFRERSQVMMQVMVREMTPLMASMEPEMREGMAEAFAGKYSPAELDQINAFLMTQTGAKFGGGFMQLASDPAYLARVQAMIPRIVEAMPTMIAKAAEAEKSLPKARSYADLTKAEKARLEALLGEPDKDQ